MYEVATQLFVNIENILILCRGKYGNFKVMKRIYEKFTQ